MSGPAIVPQHISFTKWAAQQAFVRPDLTWPNPCYVHEWHEWANDVFFLNPSIKNLPSPSHHVYPHAQDWRHWAAQMLFALT